MSNQEQKEIELEMAEIDHHIEMGEALNRLRENKDFQTLIMTGYLGQKVTSSVSLLAVPQIKEQGRRADIMEDLIAASNLEYFFSMVDNFYEAAKEPLLTAEEEAAMEGEE